jgi:hypothetical protein
MENTNTQPDSGSQEGANTPVADNLGKFSEDSLADFIKNNFLDEEGAAPAKEEQTESETEEPTTEESSDVETEVQDEVDHSSDEEDNSPLSRGVQKRINKLVAAKKAAQAKLQEQEERLAVMQRELEAAKSLTVVARQQNISPQAEALNTIAEVQAEYKRAVDVLLWCEENVEGGEIPGPEGPIEITDKQVRDMKRLAIRTKEVDLPARMAYLQQQASVAPKIAQSFPWLNKPESEEYQAASTLLRDFPEIRRRPDYLHLAGIFVEGLKAYSQRQAAPKQTPIKRAPAQPSVKAAPAKPDDSSRASKAFMQDTSSRDGLSNLLKAKGFV